ncbi:MAG: endolytic transglycosylase MltG [Bacteroidales bacterium]|nr:endolytic transglycosylase MltG [Bacteroidales bacterium]
MKRKAFIAGAAAVAVLGVAMLCFALSLYTDYRRSAFSGRSEIYVRPGEDPQALLDSILATGSVRHPRSLKRCFSRTGADESVKVGHYTLDPTSCGMYAARMFRNGWQSPVNLTLSGAIRSKGALSRKIGAQMLLDSSDVADALVSPAFLAGYGVDTTTLFCLIIPDTYQVYWTDPVEKVFDTFKTAHDRFWTEERQRKASAQGLTPNEVSVLASIVDGETRYVPEQPAIAGVYLNRLHTGMKLQADPTVAYLYGYTLRRILKRHLEIDSPYNTYMYAGLPPGPISCPPKSCLEAVLNPDRHGYLYFCANPSFDGSHLFATTYPEHLRNARAFQKALSERL